MLNLNLLNLQAFFTRWWDEQSAATQTLARRLVSEGRLGFVNGGWVQHDEAAAHFVAMIDQTTRGHRWVGLLLWVCMCI